jgi:steroid delta-isomerase-like uncharacterized protein
VSSYDLKAIVRRIPLEAFSKGDLSAIDQTLSANFNDHAEFPGLGHDREAAKQLAGILRTAFPDFHYDVKSELADGNYVAILAEASGTHNGNFMGIAPTGKKATWNEIHYVRFDGDRIAEHWASIDQFSMMQQLGLVPALSGQPGQPTPSRTSYGTSVGGMGMGNVFSPSGRTSSFQDNKAVVRRWLEQGFNQGDLAIVSQLFTPDFVNHDSTFPPGMRGHDGVKAFTSSILHAFPDCHMTVHDQIAEGDRVFTRWSATGTHKGDLFGIAPTGKSGYTVWGMEFDRFADGKMAESWVVWDVFGLLNFLGVIPGPGH